MTRQGRVAMGVFQCLVLLVFLPARGVGETSQEIDDFYLPRTLTKRQAAEESRPIPLTQPGDGAPIPLKQSTLAFGDKADSAASSTQSRVAAASATAGADEHPRSTQYHRRKLINRSRFRYHGSRKRARGRPAIITTPKQPGKTYLYPFGSHGEIAVFGNEEDSSDYTKWLIRTRNQGAKTNGGSNGAVARGNLGRRRLSTGFGQRRRRIQDGGVSAQSSSRERVVERRVGYAEDRGRVDRTLASHADRRERTIDPNDQVTTDAQRRQQEVSREQQRTRVSNTGNRQTRVRPNRRDDRRAEIDRRYAEREAERRRRLEEHRRARLERRRQLEERRRMRQKMIQERQSRTQRTGADRQPVVLETPSEVSTRRQSDRREEILTSSKNSNRTHGGNSRTQNSVDSRGQYVRHGTRNRTRNYVGRRQYGERGGGSNQSNTNILPSGPGVSLTGNRPRQTDSARNRYERLQNSRIRFAERQSVSSTERQSNGRPSHTSAQSHGGTETIYTDSNGTHSQGRVSAHSVSSHSGSQQSATHRQLGGGSSQTVHGQHSGGVTGHTASRQHTGGGTGQTVSRQYTGGVTGHTASRQHAGGVTGHTATRQYAGGVTGHTASRQHTGGVTGHTASRQHTGGVTGHTASRQYTGGVTGHTASRQHTGGVTGHTAGRQLTGGVTGQTASRQHSGSVTGQAVYRQQFGSTFPRYRQSHNYNTTGGAHTNHSFSGRYVGGRHVIPSQRVVSGLEQSVYIDPVDTLSSGQRQTSSRTRVQATNRRTGYNTRTRGRGARTHSTNQQSGRGTRTHSTNQQSGPRSGSTSSTGRQRYTQTTYRYIPYGGFSNYRGTAQHYGDCPETGIRIRINGIECEQAVDHFGSFLCYRHEYTSRECCEKCRTLKNSARVGCEFGDHSGQCPTLNSWDCYDLRNRQTCCDTCERHRKQDARPGCEYGDMTPRCDQVRREPSLCYIPDNQRMCCETCDAIKNTRNPTCPWGDQNSELCQLFDSGGNARINCYAEPLRRICCQSCQRLRAWIPDNVPADCEYGDRPVIFNTGTHGSLNCTTFFRYFGYDQCRFNEAVSSNCCYTCHRFSSRIRGTS